MQPYSKYFRGSEWRKWDIHIHTPETKKNDQFEGTTPEIKWEKYVETINSSKEDIAVIGITDYFCVDNYFKFLKLMGDRKITKQFEMVLPNVEIRVLPVTGSSTPINLHCIFNPEIGSEIEIRFLAKLKFSYSGSDYSAKKEELVRLGKSINGNPSMGNAEALKAGVAQYVITMDSLKSIFEKDAKLRENVVVVVSNSSNDGVSGIIKHQDFFIGNSQSQLDATRQSIYQFADAIFSSNESDVEYFTGKGVDQKETVIKKCGTLMPCFHGCDAHENSKVFKPDQNRFCWIKADPTFEGLKQVLYEPEERVKIQPLKPDPKNDRYVISQVKFLDTDKLFGTQEIFLNENLNAIIGGKSSGKSLLLYSMAKSIDPEQVNRAAKRLNFEGYKFDSSLNFEVTWKNGQIDYLRSAELSPKNNKIIYIPQLYINHLVEKNNKEELNTLIKNILLQDMEFKEFFDAQVFEIEIVTSEIKKSIVKYLQIRQKALDAIKKSSETGNSGVIKTAIAKIESDITEGQKASNLSPEEFASYTKLTAEKSAMELNIKDLDSKASILGKVLGKIYAAKVDLLGQNDDILDIYVKGEIDTILDDLATLTPQIAEIRDKLISDFEILLRNLQIGIANLKIAEEKTNTSTEITRINAALSLFLTKLAGQRELQKLSAQLEKEKLRLNEAVIFEKQIKTLQLEYELVRKQTVGLLRKRYDLYNIISDQINVTKNRIGPDIFLHCDLIYKKVNFQLFEQANKAAMPTDHFFNTLFNEGDLVNYPMVIDLYSKSLRQSEDKIIIYPNLDIPLRQKVTFEQVINGLTEDKFEFDYSVTYKGDDLLSMSPGKKGTVLLILFLQISSSEYPILIDQPEDNLDNRTIYDLLCKMIKQKKKERQIIIVSHNANLVVATDSENIIVANQEGQGTVIPEDFTRFEYINGSIENSFFKLPAEISILRRQGIKEHVCDILEGGDEAFKQRERKYAIK